MTEISLRKIILEKSPNFLHFLPSIFRNLTFYFIEKVFFQKEINQFISNHSLKKNIDFIDEFFEYLDFSFQMSVKDKAKIPSEGKLICVSNHPLGGLDGLVLLKMLSEVRTDIKILVNDILTSIDNINDFFIPYDLTKKKFKKESLTKIKEAMDNGNVIVIFPAGEVSRLGFSGIKDSKWNKGAIHFAEKFTAPILPVYISGKNSLLFYFISAINKRFSTFLLPYELFNKKHKVITVKVGNYIPASAFTNSLYKKKYQVDLLRKHVYLLPKNKNVFKTEKNVIHPVSKIVLKKQFREAEILGYTNNKKLILLTDMNKSPEVIREICRLREITFRKVSEGTGFKLDIDKYDETYKHIVLWDENELEIVGSYRLGICKDLIKENDFSRLYTSSLFYYSEELKVILNDSIELGRSFIQSKYWGSSALDNLWQGIGAYLNSNRGIKYLFGAVSISKSYPEEVKNHIIFFYRKWFGKSRIAEAKNRYIIPKIYEDELKEIFCSDYQNDLITLKSKLKLFGCSIPTLYKQYTELCEKGGVHFLDFGVDPDFNDCIDGLLLLDLSYIKESKKRRYIEGIRAIQEKVIQ